MNASRDFVTDITANDLRARLLHFLNCVLPGLTDRNAPWPEPILADTYLFQTNLIDSLAIIQLVAFIEETTGHDIPMRMVVMKNFQTVNAIVEAFTENEQTSQ